MAAPAGGRTDSRGLSAWRVAVLLSAASAFLGLARELLIVRRLGLGRATDELQFALSVVYTIALLGEPLRLLSLNTLGRPVAPPARAALGAGIAAVAAVLAGLYALGGPAVSGEWLLLAGVGGAGNLALAWVLPRALHAGPFVPVHAIAVLPSFLIFGGLAWPAASDAGFASRAVALFAVAPGVQLLLLALVARWGSGEPGSPPLRVGDLARTAPWHLAGAAGQQLGQVVLRSALLAGPAGAMSALVLVLRATETVRAVLVDSYIASQLRRWAAGARGTLALLDGRWLPRASDVLVVAGALGLALVLPERVRGFHLPVGALVLLGAYHAMALRVRYQGANTAMALPALLRRMAGLELGCLAAVGVVALVAPAPVVLLAWVVFIVRPVAGLRLVPPATDRLPDADQAP